MNTAIANEEDRTFSPIDRFVHASRARLTLGLSSASTMLAFLDWAVHLNNSPGKQGELAQSAFLKSSRFAAYLSQAASDKARPHCI